VQERVGCTLELIDIGNDFLTRTQLAQQLIESIDKGLQETKKLHNKRNGHQTEEAALRIGGNCCQLYIRQEINNQNIQGVQKIKFPQK
jgi:hypothetical protein